MRSNKTDTRSQRRCGLTEDPIDGFHEACATRHEHETGAACGESRLKTSTATHCRLEKMCQGYSTKKEGGRRRCQRIKSGRLSSGTLQKRQFHSKLEARPPRHIQDRYQRMQGASRHTFHPLSLIPCLRASPTPKLCGRGMTRRTLFQQGLMRLAEITE
jgi:hypothetical protein